MSAAAATAATKSPNEEPVAQQGTEPVAFLGRLLETIEVYDERYKLVDGASTMAADVLNKYPSIATTAESSYALAKAKLLPESYIETVETMEKEICGLDKESLISHVGTIDNKIAETLKGVQSSKDSTIQAVQDRIAETQDKILATASETTMYGLETVESGIDYVLPDGEEQPSTEAKEGEAEPSSSVATKPLLNKAVGISKKAQRKLQKKAFEGLAGLRFRPVQLGAAVDLIQYNRFLDVDLIQEKAGAAKVALDENVVKAWEVLESSEIVVKVKPVLDELEGKAGDALAKIKTVIVEPARDFYTTVVIEFVNDPSLAAKEFRANVEKAVGSEWTKALEKPTMELWQTMTELYQKMDVPPAGSDMQTWKETLVANVGTLLDTAWAATTTPVAADPGVDEAGSTAESTPAQGAEPETKTAAAEPSSAAVLVVDAKSPAISAPTTTPTKAEEDPETDVSTPEATPLEVLKEQSVAPQANSGEDVSE